jgi:hypothetical protein
VVDPLRNKSHHNGGFLFLDEGGRRLPVSCKGMLAMQASPGRPKALCFEWELASVEKQVKHGRERLIGLELSCIARLTRRFNAKWVPGTFRKRDTPLSD